MVGVGQTFARRAVAFLLDTLVVYLVGLAAAFATGFVVSFVFILITGRAPEIDDARLNIVSFVFGLLLTTLYYFLFEVVHGASPGKAMLGMRVVMDDGRRCTPRAAITRGLMRYLDSLFFGFPAIMVMKAPLYQRYGDRQAHTLVLRRNDPLIRAPAGVVRWLVAAGAYAACAPVMYAIMFSLTMR
jgi:uncharacterized RDD family membrane protein YckC